MARKPRKKVVTTVEEQEIDEQQPEIEHIPFDPEMDALERIRSQFGATSGVKIKVSRMEPHGLVYVHTYPCQCHAIANVGEVDEAFIQRTHGGGKYTLKVFSGAEVLDVINLELDAPLGGIAKENPNGNAGAAPDLASILQQQNNLLLQALLNKSTNGHETTPAGELAQAVVALRGIERPPENNGGEKIFEAFMKGIEFMSRGGAPPEDNSWGGLLKGFIRDAGPAIAPMLGGLLNRPQLPQNAPGGAPMPQPNGLPVQLQQMLAQGFAYLKKKAMAGKDPAVFVEMILENRDEEMFQELVALICENEFEIIARLDPEIAQPRYRPFFESIYNGVRAGIFEEQQPMAFSPEEQNPDGSEQPQTEINLDSGRPSGDARNPADHGGAGKGRTKKPKS